MCDHMNMFVRAHIEDANYVRRLPWERVSALALIVVLGSATRENNDI